MPAPRRSTLSFLTVAALAFAPSLAATSTAPVTLDDVVALLKAGAGEALIMREIGSGAPAFVIGVQETLRLKQAGASDPFIESLMGEPVTPGANGASGADETAARSYRVLKEMTADGREILHVTNLDASGKRMGATARRAPDSSAPAPRASDDYPATDDAPPVIVNVYQPAPQGASGYVEEYTSPYMYRDPYAYNYPRGTLPGYYPYLYYGAGGYGGVGHGGSRGHCDLPRGGPHPAPHGPGRTGMSGPRHYAGPTYSPIGPATGYDMYRSHTQSALRR